MADNNQQIPWTDEQWARVRQVIQEEAARARVAAAFLPLVGPLAANADYVAGDRMGYSLNGEARLTIDDRSTITLATLQVKVFLRGAQMADPEMGSALQMFRRAANILARLEDSVVFNGIEYDRNKPQIKPHPRRLKPSPELLIGEILGDAADGLLDVATRSDGVVYDKLPRKDPDLDGNQLVEVISACVGELEDKGHFGPFAVVLGQNYFTQAQTPNPGSLVLPQDRIIPFLGGGPLARSTTLPSHAGLVIALGAAPIELVVATDVSLNFLQVTPDPAFVFRVFEKIVLRIKETDAVRLVTMPEPPASGSKPR